MGDFGIAQLVGAVIGSITAVFILAIVRLVKTHKDSEY